MTPEQALQDIDNALAQMTVNRVTHAHLIKCIQTLSDALTPVNAENGDRQVTL